MKVIIGFVLLVAVFAHQEQCPENQHFDSCGSACPLTCDNYENLIIPCVAMCVPGCLCDEGFVRKEDGTCVIPENCPNRCPENQHFTRCGTDCPLTCENYLDPPQICNLMCVSGCECDPGYLKRRDGACVLPVDCLLWGDPDVKNCVDKPDSGMCMALFFKFHYDQNTESCHQFVYGGCGGNGNNYDSERECLQHCKGAEEVNCNADADAGPCRAFMRRYFFNKSEGVCQEFFYGGCQGNTNNFETMAECTNACGGNQ
ncbi:kunitz-type U19-barytoxin-Tl1a [Caerostris extrusa]|uniref:Kunitz-type U19-barytoxin-Tl1a n=1 Tax=Caerostris extrusa TaxID=172846 RepID=A0AAV4W554_CAEEX|nr:kunitz-type U19-barytoxin-Tl1a [Caerostris extrusa]